MSVKLVNVETELHWRPRIFFVSVSGVTRSHFSVLSVYHLHSIDSIFWRKSWLPQDDKIEKNIITGTWSLTRATWNWFIFKDLDPTQINKEWGTYLWINSTLSFKFNLIILQISVNCRQINFLHIFDDEQCYQKVIVFFNIWPLAMTKISPIMIQICQSRLNILPNKK